MLPFQLKLPSWFWEEEPVEYNKLFAIRAGVKFFLLGLKLEVDETALVVDEVEIVVQINGKLKDRLLAGVSESKESVLAKAKDLPKVKEALAEKSIKKEIVVPGRLINIVIG